MKIRHGIFRIGFLLYAIYPPEIKSSGHVVNTALCYKQQQRLWLQKHSHIYALSHTMFLSILCTLFCQCFVLSRVYSSFHWIYELCIVKKPGSIQARNCPNIYLKTSSCMHLPRDWRCDEPCVWLLKWSDLDWMHLVYVIQSKNVADIW